MHQPYTPRQSSQLQLTRKAPRRPWQLSLPQPGPHRPHRQNSFCPWARQNWEIPPWEPRQPPALPMSPKQLPRPLQACQQLLQEMPWKLPLQLLDLGS